jgi:uncharacterized protein
MNYLLLCLALAAASSLAAQSVSPELKFKEDSTFVARNYTKREVQIPMRDGIKLFTTIYAPKDVSKPHPILLNRTPYSNAPYGTEINFVSLSRLIDFLKEGYIIVGQDVRGRWMSEGEFIDVRPFIPEKKTNQDIDEASDTYDTIEWLTKNVPSTNGKVGVWGISYPGFYSTMAILSKHPALKAASPQAPVTDWFIGDDFHHNGAFFLMDAFYFYHYRGFGKLRPSPTAVGPKPINYDMNDTYNFYLKLGALSNVKTRINDTVPFWDTVMAHPNYDAFWKVRTPLPHLKGITCAVMTVGGWFDAEDLYGPLKTYRAIEQQNPGITNILVMGPWTHGGWMRGDASSLDAISFGSATAEHYRKNIFLTFFNHYLKNSEPTSGSTSGASAVPLPEASIFETGSNEWKRYDVWTPTVTEKNLYLNAANTLSFMPPSETKAFDEYISDPAKPVPYTSKISAERGVTYMIEDQRFASRRTDVLTYQTDVLQSPLTLSGNIIANLFVNSTATDADFVVKVIDVLPDSAQGQLSAFQMLVRAEVMRAKYRGGFESPKPLKPNTVEPVSFELQDVAHTFKPGHRVMVQIQSSWFPLVDRNPQKFMNIYQATDVDFQKATHKIFRTAKFPSHLRVKVVEK